MSQDEHEGEHGPNSHALHQPQQHCRTHPTVAVDLDEVLGRTVDGIVAFHNATYGTTLSAHDFTSYNYWNVWGGTREESIAKIRAFYQSPFFLGEGGLAPVPGALAALTALKADGFRLVVVTSRQEVVRAETQRWLDQHFAGIFDELHLGNSFLSTAEQQTITFRHKADICAEVGAVALIDDSLTWVEDCLTHGIRAILFDLEGAYMWNKGPSKLDKFITRVTSWEGLLAVKHLLTTPVNKFDVQAALWDEKPEPTIVSAKFAGLLEERKTLGPALDVLDFGAGTGLLSTAIAAKVRSVTAVDMSEGMIEVLKNKISANGFKNITAICKEIKSASDLPQQYDLIVSSLVFHHIDELASTVALLRSLLKPASGSKLIVMDLERHPEQTELFHPKAAHGSVSHHGIAVADMEQWYKDAGFASVAVDLPAELTKTVETGATVSFPLFYALGSL